MNLNERNMMMEEVVGERESTERREEERKRKRKEEEEKGKEKQRKGVIKKLKMENEELEAVRLRNKEKEKKRKGEEEEEEKEEKMRKELKENSFKVCASSFSFFLFFGEGERRGERVSPHTIFFELFFLSKNKQTKKSLKIFEEFLNIYLFLKTKGWNNSSLYCCSRRRCKVWKNSPFYCC